MIQYNVLMMVLWIALISGTEASSSK